MNISKYKALLCAVDLGSFSAAAQKLGYTQSGLTHMMNALESEIGFAVLERGHFGIKLTPWGERLIPTIRELVTIEDALNNEISLVKSFGDTIIRIGSYSSVSSTWLPSIVERFNLEYPDVTVNIQTGTVAEVYGGLAEGRFDFCYVARNPRYDYKMIPLFSDPFWAVLPKDFPTVSREFPLTSFNGTKFLMPGLGFDDDISAIFAENHVKPFVTQTYVDDPAILSMVEHRLGVSMLSELILTGRRDEVKLLPVTPAVSRSICIAMKHDKVLTTVQKRLIAITKEFVKDYQTKIFVDFE